MGLSTGSSRVSRSSGGLNKCECGYPAKIFTSKTEKNPGRRFYGCPLYKVGGYQHCKFFKWYDQEEVKGGKFFKWFGQEEVKKGKFFKWYDQEEVKGGKFFKWFGQEEVKKGKFFKWYDQEELKGGKFFKLYDQEEVKGGWPRESILPENQLLARMFDLFDFV